MARKERVTKVTDGDSFETASRKHPVWRCSAHRRIE